MKRGVRLAVATAVVVAVAGVTFLGVRALVDDDGAQATLPPLDSAAIVDDSPGSTPTPVVPIAPPDEPFDLDRAKPRFEGDILGIYFTSSVENAPEEYVTDEDVCGPRESATYASVEWADAGEFDLTQIALPGDWEFQEEDMNTFVFSCNGEIALAAVTYTKPLMNGDRAQLRILRNYYTVDTPDAPADRIQETVFAGHQAILIEPVTEDGRDSLSAVYFPGMPKTQIGAFQLSLDDLLEIAEAVAAQLGN